MKCQIKCDVKCFYYNPKSQYCTMLHVLIIDSLHIINNNTKMIQRSVSEDPVKMNDERDLICIRQMNESFTSRPCLRVNERSGRGTSRSLLDCVFCTNTD